jgi:hypothetical protein
MDATVRGRTRQDAMKVVDSLHPDAIAMLRRVQEGALAHHEVSFSESIMLGGMKAQLLVDRVRTDRGEFAVTTSWGDAVLGAYDAKQAPARERSGQAYLDLPEAVMQVMRPAEEEKTAAKEPPQS